MLAASSTSNFSPVTLVAMLLPTAQLQLHFDYTEVNYQATPAETPNPEHPVQKFHLLTHH
jgi:hypothetical protein